jgi:hypothetical protein
VDRKTRAPHGAILSSFSWSENRRAGQTVGSSAVYDRHASRLSAPPHRREISLWNAPSRRSNARPSCESFRFAPVRRTASGTPRPSQIRWRLLPRLARSVGLGPVCAEAGYILRLADLGRTTQFADHRHRVARAVSATRLRACAGIPSPRGRGQGVRRRGFGELQPHKFNLRRCC